MKLQALPARWLAGFVGLVLMSTAASGAWATTRSMNDRDALKGTPVVIWGNTTLPNGTPFTIDFGDLSPTVGGLVADQSYIATTHTYGTTGIFTATLTVGAETATTQVQVFDPAALTPDNLRALKINLAIEDGLRYLYFSQTNRAANFTASPNIKLWNEFGFGLAGSISATSLAALAFQNHGHQVNDDPNADIYQPLVQGALNYVFDRVGQVTVTAEPAGNPCVGGVEPAPCVGLAQISTFSTGYSSSIATLAVAAAAAADPTRLVAAGVGVNNGFFVTGKQYDEILQRMVNTVAWAQADSGFNRGGWRYGLDDNQSDGSAIGWAVLALLDGQAAGAVVPGFVATELANVIANTSCDDGGGPLSNGLSYAGCGRGNVLRTGIALQAHNLMGTPLADPRVQNAINYINDAWTSFHPNGEDFSCAIPSGLGAGSPPGSANNMGCAYAMFQVFKGLKLYGEVTLTNVVRPDNDWHKEYQDYLVINQQNPTNTGGGRWSSPQMWWSCCGSAVASVTALAELILSPVALVLPANLTLAPATDENFVDENHTVTATATSAAPAPVPGVTVDFEVTAGPNAGATGSDVTDTNGEANFTYNNPTQTPGTDTIVATAGSLTSNTVEKVWVLRNQPPVAVCTPDQVLECTGNDEADTSIDGGSFDPDGASDIASIVEVPDGPYPLDVSTLVTLTITDLAGEMDMCTAMVTVEDTKDPSLACPGPVTLSADDQCEATVNLEAQASDICDSNVDLSDDAPGVYPLGDTTVTFIATDDSGNSAACSTQVTVVDDTPPEVSPSTVTETLWPPNHELVDVGFSPGISDACDDSTTVSISVTADEPYDDSADGKFSPDARFVKNAGGDVVGLRLRSERKGNGDGRVYLIRVTATDAAGNESSACSAVTVTHSQSDADVASVAAQAAAAVATCQPLDNDVLAVSDGGSAPDIGSKQ